jgi:glycosyltransferase involved in cell wall biosynthesis
VADLPVLLKQGHELGCHTFAHCDSWETAPEKFEASVIQNRAELKKMIPGADFRSFSYPISLPRPQTKGRIAKYFESCRAGGQTLNADRGDLNQLSAFFLEMSRNNFPAIQRLIDRNCHRRGWLIFATHDISDTPTPFGCTPDFFEQVVAYAVASGARILPVARAVEQIRAGQPGRATVSVPRVVPAQPRATANALVSILIPAHNAQEWIADTLRSALAQTWEPKEIIVVDDGSTDQSLAVARTFEAQGVQVIAQRNAGAAAARNRAFAECRGAYIQWLDADDLLAPGKIAVQMESLQGSRGKKTLLSAPYGKFMYRWYQADFVPSQLWHDLSPTEWLLRKMGQNLFMQTATWLVSRELTEAAGPWDVRLRGNDDDGEYFCRVLRASDGVHFVRDARVYYRVFGYDSLSYIGVSDLKLEALWLSMQLHIQYLRSMEESPRSRAACIDYLQRNLFYFVPNRPDIAGEATKLARDMGGELGPPQLSWEYSALCSVIGWKRTKQLAMELRTMRKSINKFVDRTLFTFDNRTRRAPVFSLKENVIFAESTNAR